MQQQPISPPRWLACAALAATAGIMLYFFIYVFRHTFRGHFEDFWHFYTAAQALDQGKSPYQVIAPGFDHPGYIYPPLVAFLYWPLAHFLSIANAARIALVLNLTALAAALYLGARAMLERLAGKALSSRAGSSCFSVAALLTPVLILAALVLTFDKAKGELQMLQTNALILAALALALHQLDRRPWLVGAALGFALNIKYQTLIMLPYLLLRRRWKAAAWMAVWTILFALLPALLVGLPTELVYLKIAFAGLLRLVGISSGPGADIENIRAGFSISITSAVARALATRGSTLSPMLPAALIGIVWLALLATLYAIRRTPILRWPKASAQTAAPFPRIIALEWMLLIATTLAFSPQTNTRHLLLVVLLNLGALALLTSQIAAKNLRAAALVIAAIVILWAGITLPPGHRTSAPTTAAATASSEPRHDIQDPAVASWHNIAGPSWSILLAMALITCSALGKQDESKLRS